MRANDWAAEAAGARASAARRGQLEGRLGGRLSFADRRRLGVGLASFGIAGLVILVTTAVFVLAAFGSAGPTGGDLQAQLSALDRSLDATASTLAATRTATGNLDSSVTNAASAARGASALATQLATTMHDVSAAMNLDFLGTRPFASLGVEFDQVGARSTDLAGQLNTVASSLDTNASDVSALSGQVGALQASVQQLRDSVGPGTALSNTASFVSLARALLLALVIWLAVPAIAATWLGVRMYRSAQRARRMTA